MVVAGRAGSETGGLPQPFLQLTRETLDFQSGKVVISIALMSVLRRLRGSEKVHERAIVKCVHPRGHVEWMPAQRIH